MSNFFVKDEVYQERIALCRECVYYFKPTGNCKICGCFMKIKSRISSMSCPKKHWTATNKIENPDIIPEELIEECLLIWEDVKTGVAKNVTIKKKMIELYNTIYNANFKTTSNCSSCLNSCYYGIRQIVEKYKT